MNELIDWRSHDQSQEPLELSAHQRIKDSGKETLDLGVSSPMEEVDNPNRSPKQTSPFGRSDYSSIRSHHSQIGPPSNHSLLSDVEDADSFTDSETGKYDVAKGSVGRDRSPDHGDRISTSSGEPSPKPEIETVFDCLSASATAAKVQDVILCFWCKRVCEKRGMEAGANCTREERFPLTSGNGHFCSEICFNRSRRASFKKSKICNWCRHVRPTVCYVDFTDGNHQLQFCSEKCLNQYKMQIFCRETEAHLQLHPHLSHLGSREGALITPDLWLKDCLRTENSKREPLPEKDSEEELPFVDVSSSEAKHRQFRNKYGSSSSDSSSPSPLSLSECEPVNLSTTQPHTGEGVPRRSSLSRKFTKTERNAKVSSLWNERPKSTKTSSSEGGNFGASPSTILENAKVSKGTIRVRQLSGNEAASSSFLSASPSTSKTIFPGLGALEGLLIGSQPHLLPGIPPMIHHPPGIPRPQILPQLLFSHADLLRLRPPIMLPQPPLPTPLPQNPPPPLPIPTNPLHVQPLPSQNLPYPPPIGFPPITVLLPLPLPIPIPIPIPIPLPIPVTKDPKTGAMKIALLEMEDSHHLQGNYSDQNILLSRLSAESKVRGDENRSSGLCLSQEQSLGRPDESSNCDNVVRKAETKPIGLDIVSKATSPKRRSILKYTSDVYEINGVFVPREGSWDTIPQNGIQFPEQKKESTSAATEPRCSAVKKKRTSVDHKASVSKKKHLFA